MAERGQARQVGDSVQEFTFRNVQLLKNETLGTGSYGAVCKAKCDQLISAAKLLYPVLFQIQAPNPGKEHRQPFRRFEQECQFLSRVNHPNIVQYLGTYRDPETNAPVLLMELMDESLTHFLESSPGDIPYHIQVNLSQDIAQALAFLHANGIIHRDLSSNNVLLIAGSRAKVTDFGMSKFTDLNATHLATMTTCPGTPAFMSPEALDEPPVYTEKLDNFSFGVLLVQIVTRQFPAPSDRFEIERIPNRRNPTRMVEARVLIPEIERRQAHINLIEPTHPLLPIALECLKDEAVERPSSEQLCQSLDAFKGTAKYEESQQQENAQHLQEQVREKDLQIQTNNQDIQVLQNEVKTKEDQLRRLNQQLESNEGITATFKHTITQRDREIAELREMLATLDCEQSKSHHSGGRIVQASPNSEERISMSWEILSPKFVLAIAVVDDKIYFHFGGSVLEYISTSGHQYKLPDPPVNSLVSLVNIKNELTIVGGYFENRQRNFEDSNKLYSYIEGKWVEKYPPMPTKRYSCAAVYANPVLIVAGGKNQQAFFYAIVEILNTQTKQWSSVSSLHFPTCEPSVSICGEHIYAHARYVPYSIEATSVLRCSMFSLVFSTPESDIWEKIASLPVMKSELVSVKGQLLAVGGESSKDVPIKEIYQYNPSTDSWQVVSRMNIARSQCLARLLPNNKLIVGGGSASGKPIELATISLH